MTTGANERVSPVRLPWRRYPEVSGFIAHTDGVRHRYSAVCRGRHVSLACQATPPNKSPADFEAGTWRNGLADSMQAVQTGNGGLASEGCLRRR